MNAIKTILIIIPLLTIMSCQNKTNPVEQNSQINTVEEDATPEYALVIHGGAGVITRENMTPESEGQIIAALTQALIAGEVVLKAGGSSLDAIEAAITTMEDAPYFNAGKGAVFTHDGKNELDASIMDGATRMAGAVGGVTTVKNPIRAARAVMEKSPHVMLTGEGANEFVASAGLEIVDPKYFFTQNRFLGFFVFDH